MARLTEVPGSHHNAGVVAAKEIGAAMKDLSGCPDTALVIPRGCV
jgi:hypothetical protein